MRVVSSITDIRGTRTSNGGLLTSQSLTDEEASQIGCAVRLGAVHLHDCARPPKRVKAGLLKAKAERISKKATKRLLTNLIGETVGLAPYPAPILEILALILTLMGPSPPRQRRSSAYKS